MEIVVIVTTFQGEIIYLQYSDILKLKDFEANWGIRFQTFVIFDTATVFTVF